MLIAMVHAGVVALYKSSRAEATRAETAPIMWEMALNGSLIFKLDDNARIL